MTDSQSSRPQSGLDISNITVDELTKAYQRMKKIDASMKVRNAKYYLARHAKDPGYYARKKAESRARVKAQAEAQYEADIASGAIKRITVEELIELAAKTREQHEGTPGCNIA